MDSVLIFVSIIAIVNYFNEYSLLLALADLKSTFHDMPSIIFGISVAICSTKFKIFRMYSRNIVSCLIEAIFYVFTMDVMMTLWQKTEGYLVLAVDQFYMKYRKKSPEPQVSHSFMIFIVICLLILAILKSQIISRTFTDQSDNVADFKENLTDFMVVHPDCPLHGENYDADRPILRLKSE
jgi:hypothetical protein